ncbi:MAG: hypothetical protein KAR42_10395 [candidate division Zixibacteria bacterium]|nr:hypothetical protein [candidate division Zixibacteria bacterium]
MDTTISNKQHLSSEPVNLNSKIKTLKMSKQSQFAVSHTQSMYYRVFYENWLEKTYVNMKNARYPSQTGEAIYSP